MEIKKHGNDFLFSYIGTNPANDDSTFVQYPSPPSTTRLTQSDADLLHFCHQATTPFIEHSLPDLTPGQKQSLRNISRVEGPKIKYLESSVQKKRKYQSFEKQSIQTAAKEFLEKAARELLGDKGGFEGPLQAEASDEDNVHAT